MLRNRYNIAFVVIVNKYYCVNKNYFFFTDLGLNDHNKLNMF